MQAELRRREGANLEGEPWQSKEVARSSTYRGSSAEASAPRAEENSDDDWGTE